MIEKPLSAVAEVIAGQSPPSSTYNQDKVGVPFFQGKADFNELYPTVRYWCSIPKKMSKPNDILFSLRAPVGPTNLNNIDACIGRGLAAIRIKENTSLSYVLHYLRANEEKIASLGTGSTFKAIKVGDLKSLQIPLPPLPQQKKIAAILDEADAYRQKTKALISKYDELTQSLFLDMFGDPGGNPNHYESFKVDDIATKVTDGDHATPKREESGIKLLSCRNIKNGYIDFQAGLDYVGKEEFDRMFKRCNPEYGDILISCSGTIGRTTAVKIDEPFVLVRSAALIKPKRELTNSLYLEYYFRTSYMQAVMIRNANTSSQANLFTGPIKKLPVLVPPLTLQIQFAERVEAIEAQKAQAQQELEKAEELFGSLLQGAFKNGLEQDVKD